MKSSRIGICIVLLSFIFLTSLFSGCKKEEDQSTTVKKFDDISIADLKEKESSFSTTDLDISNSAGLVMNTGTILFYKTSLGNYGKLEIISIDASDNFKITLKAKTFSPEGTLVSETSSLAIRGTWSGELDTMTESEENTSADFWHERLNETDSKWVAKNGALFFRYNP